MDPQGSPVWGLVRVLATEDPFLRATLIDIEDDGDIDRVYRELSSKHSEEVAYRNGERLIQRCQRLRVQYLRTFDLRFCCINRAAVQGLGVAVLAGVLLVRWVKAISFVAPSDSPAGSLPEARLF